MQDIIEIIKRKKLFSKSEGVQEQDILAAEEQIFVIFSDDYKRYLLVMGFVIYEGHELTGICKSKRLNVVDVTLMERERFSNIPSDWYVVEQLNIDGIVIWQSSSGEIYQTSPNSEPKKIYDSLVEYISSM